MRTGPHPLDSSVRQLLADRAIADPNPHGKPVSTALEFFEMQRRMLEILLPKQIIFLSQI